MSKTNIIPFANTTAIIRELTPGATYKASSSKEWHHPTWLACKRRITGTMPPWPSAPHMLPSPLHTCAQRRQISVQAFSVAYQDGGSAHVTYALSLTWAPPAHAPGPPTNLKVELNGNEVWVSRRRAAPGWNPRPLLKLDDSPITCLPPPPEGSRRRPRSEGPTYSPLPVPSHQMVWSASEGASFYAITAYDAFSGRSLGIVYKTRSPHIDVPGLPSSQTVRLEVQVK